MPIVVQKFGGTSVADAARIHLAARRAVRALLDGNQVVLVVSAMGHTTDHLAELAAQVSRRPAKRELDMLLATGEQVSIALMAMAMNEAGYEAISLTGAQAGLLTDSSHTLARIQSIDAPRIQKLLDSRPHRHRRRLSGRRSRFQHHDARPRRQRHDRRRAGRRAACGSVRDFHGRGRHLHVRSAARAAGPQA